MAEIGRQRNGRFWALPVRPLLGSALPIANVATWWTADGRLFRRPLANAAVASGTVVFNFVTFTVTVSDTNWA